MKLRVALAQTCVHANVGDNVPALLRAIDFAAAERAQILLTPEGSLSGYRHDFEPNAVRAALAEVTAKARSAGVGLALGTCYVEDDGKCYDQLRFYAPDGAYLGFHSKILRCGSLEDPPRGECEHYAITPLRTFEICGVRVGGLVCNDMWAGPTCTPGDDPHLLHKLSQQGARIVFHAVNGGRWPDHPEETRVIWNFHESNLRLRAFASKVWIVTVDSAEPPELPCSAPSGVIDPRLRGARWAIQAPNRGEQFFAYTIEE
jgi:predicted amidohydrolase